MLGSVLWGWGGLVKEPEKRKVVLVFAMINSE